MEGKVRDPSILTFVLWKNKDLQELIELDLARDYFSKLRRLLKDQGLEQVELLVNDGNYLKLLESLLGDVLSIRRVRDVLSLRESEGGNRFLLLTEPRFLSYQFEALWVQNLDRDTCGITVGGLGPPFSCVVLDHDALELGREVADSNSYACPGAFYAHNLASVQNLIQSVLSLSEGCVKENVIIRNVFPVALGGHYLNKTLGKPALNGFFSSLSSGVKPCLFLDRDGVLVEDTGYPYKIEKLCVLKEAVPLIRWARSKGWHVIVVTNQAGIAKGLFDEDDYFACTDYLNRIFQSLGAGIDRWFFCPFHPDGDVGRYRLKSVLRKPGAGMVLKAMTDLKIDLSNSIMIGDKDSDQFEFIALKTHFLRGRYSLQPSRNSGLVFESHGALLDYLSSSEKDESN